MKKIYLMLLMICSVCAFTACSDDDDEQTKPEKPVTDVKVPANAEVGAEVTLAGKGFTNASKIFLRDVAEKETVVVVKTVTTVDLVFTVPNELTTGDYMVVLSQDGGKWDLGKIAIAAKNPISGIEFPTEASVGKAFIIIGEGFADNCEVYLESESGDPVKIAGVKKVETGLEVTLPDDFVTGDYTLVIRQNGDWRLGILKVVEKGLKKLSQIVIDNEGSKKQIDLIYNEEGKIASLHVVVPGQSDYTQMIVYASSKVTVSTTGKKDFMEDMVGEDVYSLDANGRVSRYSHQLTYNQKVGDEVKAESEEFSYLYAYSQEGYLETVKDVTGEEGSESLTCTYTANNLNTVVWSADFCDFTHVYDYSNKFENNDAATGIDLSALLSEQFGYQDFIARLLGIAGKYTENIPGKVKMESTYDDPDSWPYQYTLQLTGKNSNSQMTELKITASEYGAETIYTYTLTY